MLGPLRQLTIILFLLLSVCGCGPGTGEVVEVSTSGPEGGDTTTQTTELKYLELDLPQRHYLVFRQELSFADINGFLGMESEALARAVQEADLPTLGPPTVLTYAWDTERGVADCAVAVPVAAGTELPPYVNIALPATKAIALDLAGPYDALSAYHVALDAELKRRGLTHTLPSIEEYTVGPPAVTDPARFRTRIIYPYLQPQ